MRGGSFASLRLPACQSGQEAVQNRAMRTSTSSFLVWLWPVLLIFLPSWIMNLVNMGDAGAHLVWNPLAIAALWGSSMQALLTYSLTFGCGALFSLGLCLCWFVRSPGLVHGVLLFCAAFMAGPTWKTLVTWWYALS